tara:strand:- start:2176 stop:4245 length:2070 start_codon:yes stop_codon:yes gene_type:complete
MRAVTMPRLMMRDSIIKEILPIDNVLTATPLDSIVVTVTKDGSPLSKFSDDIWDYSATSRSLKTINFRKKLESISSSQKKNDAYELNVAIRFLKTFTLSWINATGGCSMSKLNGDIVAISYLISYCFDNNSPLTNIFSSPESINSLINLASTEKQTGLLLGKIQRFTETVSVLTNNLFWAELKISSAFSDRLKQARKTFPETTDYIQTLLIPSRIYQEVLKKTLKDLELFIDNIDKIKFIFSMRALARDRGVRLDKAPNLSQLTERQSGRLQFHWKKILEENNQVSKVLRELYDAGISKSDSWSGLVENLGRWQTRCAVLIAAFTGMRKNELLAIPLNGLQSLNTENGNIPVVWSTTTKLEKNGAPRFAKWVTSSAVETAFDVARAITEGVLEWSDDRKTIEPNEQKVPLFLSVERGKKGHPHPHFSFTTASLNSGTIDKHIYEEELKVSEKDVAEISWFLYGDELPNSIKVNKPWPLKLHQFRRSMAVYAAASGYVSYPALKEQLKHISMVMTTYYSDSSSRAINILGDDLEVKALRSEWVDAKSRIEADDLYQLLGSGQSLAGSAGKKLMVQKTKGELPNFLESRQDTKQAVKNGKIRYRPTLVGGCMSIKPCNKGAGVLASACISCENAVFLPGSRAALKQTKEFYERELKIGAPKRARQEYELNIKKIDSFLSNLIETTESFYGN